MSLRLPTPKSLQPWIHPPRAVLTWFSLLMASCAAALFWLGWQVMAQEREVEKQRQRERLESAADNIAARFQLIFARGDVQIRLTESSASVTPAGGIPFVPIQEFREPDAGEKFDAAENLEFAHGRGGDAAQAYLQLAGSNEPRVRAEALMRAARVLRHERHWAEALRVYRQLEAAGESRVAGMPAALIARGGRCSVLAESGQRKELAQEAQALWLDLAGGRWAVNRQTLETYMEELRKWAPDTHLPGAWSDRLRMASAVERVWLGRVAASGRRFVIDAGDPVSVAWEDRDGIWSASVTGASHWKKAWAEAEGRFGVGLQLAQPDGTVLYESTKVGRPAAHLSAAASGLPVNLTVFPSAGFHVAENSAPNRRRLFLAGFLLFAAILGGGTFFIARAINREMAVARLQSDFVAAVSHEFRTPLTSIRQLADLLAQGRLKGQNQVQKTYQLMVSESDRLKRLVESILDFGRMRSGTYQFRFERISAADWTRQVVDEYRKTVAADNVSLEFEEEGLPAFIAADAEALRGALWNLLDNAVKYSKEKAQIRVRTCSTERAVEICVEDQGIGISKTDLSHVFERFYRGETARATGTKGTGIGLALVKEIVEAHRGMAKADSEPGRGSVFTMIFPVEKQV